MNIPENLFYTKDHEWVKVDGDIGLIGITDYAQHALGDITFIELPKKDLTVKQSNIVATIESVKAASDIYCPLSGTVILSNTQLETNPALINQSCYDKGWIAKIKINDIAEKKNLFDSASYQKFIEGLSH